MHKPTRDEFKRLASEHNVIPVYREIIADVDTPVSAFQKLDPGEYAFLLESAEGGERLGRYSFLGSDPYLVVTSRNGVVEVSENGQPARRLRDVADPLTVIRDAVAGYKAHKPEGFPPFFGGAVGYLGYDAVRHFEQVPRTGRDDLSLPDMIFMLTDSILLFDHLKHKVKVVVNAHVEGDADQVYDAATTKVDELVGKLRQRARESHAPKGGARPGASSCVESNMTRDAFEDAVRRVKEYIAAGDALQVVLSQRFCMEKRVSSFDIYRALRTINPAPYMYYLKFGQQKLVGSSPEPLVKVVGRRVTTCPIAGTRPRGASGPDDARLAEELLADEKERAEHIMLVDLGRNDLGRVSVRGTVRVDDLMYVEKASHVMHIVSHVSGRLEPGKDAFDALRACFPAGTVAGAPKIRAMEIIDELEPTLRGPYAGVVGYVSYAGDLDTCITIRTILVNGSKAYVQAGAGIVYDSQPEREYQETVDKAQALISAVRLAEGGISA